MFKPEFDLRPALLAASCLTALVVPTDAKAGGFEINKGKAFEHGGAGENKDKAGDPCQNPNMAARSPQPGDWEGVEEKTVMRGGPAASTSAR